MADIAVSVMAICLSLLYTDEVVSRPVAASTNNNISTIDLLPNALPKATFL